MNKLSILKTAVMITSLLYVNNAMAENKTNGLFIDQLNGMTRLERLKPSFNIKSN